LLPELSVIICTYDRPDDVYACVRALLSQPLSGCEIIVVDSACSAPVRLQLRSRMAGLPVRLLAVDQPGLSVARNAGLSAAQAPWVAFLDDDARVHDDWVARAKARVRHIQATEPEMAMIAGRAVPGFPTSGPVEVPPAHLGLKWLDLLSMLDSQRPGVSPHMPMVVGCNLLVHAARARQVGAFAEHLGRGQADLFGGEEIALAHALARAGYKGCFAPELVVTHLVAAQRLTWAWGRRRAQTEGRLGFLQDHRLSRVLKILLVAVVCAPAVFLMPASTLKTQTWIRLHYATGFLMAYASHLKTRRP
jgi:glycosyltransferase involved in cell wall biosynthesis